MCQAAISIDDSEGVDLFVPAQNIGMISVIIPVYNEGPRLPKVIERIRETAKSHPVEIIVVDGGSQDDSVEVAGSFADVVLTSPQSGRGAQMDFGAAHARYDLLLFLHADTQLPDGWIDILTQAWGAPNEPMATAFRLSFDNKKWIYRFYAHLAHWRSLFLGVPHGDQAIAVRREIHQKHGGFEGVPLMEEYVLLRKLRRHGRVRILSAPIVTSARRYEKKGVIINAIRNFFLISLFYLNVSPRKLAQLYRSWG